MTKTIEEIEALSSKGSVNIGFENWVISRKVVAVVNPNSAPIKRMMKTAKENNLLIDATSGRPTRSAIIMDDRHVILSSFSPRKIIRRMEKE